MVPLSISGAKPPGPPLRLNPLRLELVGTTSKALVTGTESAARAASTDKDDDYVYIRVPWEKVVPVNPVRTETVQHHVSQSAGPHNAAPVFEEVSVQLAAPASQQWLGDSTTISSARLSILQPGGSGDTSMDTVGTEPLLEALMQDVAECLAVPGASAAAEVNDLIDFGSGIIALSEELVEALRRQPGMMQIALTQAFVGRARLVTSSGKACDIVTQSCPLDLTIETPWGPARFTMPIIVLPG